MYDTTELEEKILKFWGDNKIFEKRREKNKGNKKFSFIDGPITANNPMGVHHAWGRTLKDLYQRWKALQGYDQRYQNGFDCQGLHVEVGVEKKLGFNSKKDILDYGLDKFSKVCRENVEKFAKKQTGQSIRLGQWMDWENSYYTMSDNNIKHIWHFLKKCHENGWIYKGHKSLPWCWRCGTASSKHEMSDGGYAMRKHVSVYFRAPVKGKENEYLLVWTTTPWTLTSNVLAAVSSEVEYTKVEHEGKIYYLSRVVQEKLMPDAKVLETLTGKDMEGWEYEGPFDYLEAQKDAEHKVVLWDEEVTENDGTGIVHVAPGCGEADYLLGKKLGVKPIAPLAEDGTFIEGFGWLTGKHVTEVLGPILSDLEKNNKFFKKEKVEHRYPICWRCKEDLVFRLDNAWYISADKIRETMKKNNEKIVWYPEHTQKLMEDWLTNMEDWNISRKRFWGLPLMFYDCSCGHLEVIGSLKELKQKAVNPEAVDKLPELHRPWIDEIKIKCPKCGAEIKRISEIGDCWLDAGIVPFSTLHYLDDKEYWKEWYPAEQIIEMRAQVRLWFYSMLFMSTTLEGNSSYQNVLAYEDVRDEDNKPMHKSAGNAIWFDDAVEKMGADVMRWMYLSQSPNSSVLFGYNNAKEMQQKLTFLLNIANYLGQLMKNTKIKEQNDLKLEDRWFLSRLNTVKQIVDESMEKKKYHKAVESLENFFLEDFSRGYLKYVRERVASVDEKEREKVLYVYFEVYKELLQLLSPFVPFITEHIYQKYIKEKVGEESIHLLNWPKIDKNKIDQRLEQQMEKLKEVMTIALSQREEAKRGLKWPLQTLIIESDDEIKKACENFLELMKKQLNVKEIVFKKSEELKVRLDTQITPELEAEGYANQVMRLTQRLRKKAGLKKPEKIKLFVDIKDIDLSPFEEDIKERCGAKEIVYKFEEREDKVDKKVKDKNIKISFEKV